MLMRVFFLLLIISCAGISLFAQPSKGATADSVIITVFLKHQQDKSLKQLQQIEDQNKLWDMFPPKEARVISWYVMMGIGQVVTLKIPAKDLRALNLSIENGAWGAFTTEFYPTYDYVPVWKDMMEKKKVGSANAKQ